MKGLRWVAEAASTNDLALADLEDLGLRAVGADHQSAGRGRRGRQWSSPPGCGLYLSWIARPTFPQSEGAALPLLAAAALAELCTELGARPWLKWPNDLWLGQRKLAGVLCEARQVPGGGAAVVGIGLNLRTPPGGYPPEVPGVALDSLMEPPEAQALAEQLVPRLDTWLTRVTEGGLDEVLRAWQAWAPPPGTRLKQAGREGEYAGLAPDGALRLRTASGVQLIYAGEVEILSFR